LFDIQNTSVIIPNVEFEQASSPKGGTPKQPNSVKIAAAPLGPFFLMPKIALDKYFESGKIFRLSSKGADTEHGSIHTTK
jgi:hypothetical protein